MNTIHRLKTVVLAMNKQSVTELLIPFLECTGHLTKPTALLHKEEDEVLFSIAEELGKIW